jgi:hypothetical protein
VAVFVGGVVVWAMRLGVAVGMVVPRVAVPVAVGVDDNLPGCIAAAAILGADFTGSPALGAFGGFGVRVFGIHGRSPFRAFFNVSRAAVVAAEILISPKLTIAPSPPSRNGVDKVDEV